MRVMLLIRSLEVGGAELQLLALARGLRDRCHEVEIVTFYAGGRVRDLAVGAGLRCHDLAKRSRWDLARPALRLRALTRKFEPDVVYSFLQGANVLAGLVRPLLNCGALVWGVRASNMVFRFYGASASLGLAAERLTWRAADLVICNSVAGAKFYHAQGVKASRLQVIRNGIDTDAFRPDARAGCALRRKLGVPDSTRLVGIVGRLDPVKDHVSLFRACTNLLARGFEIRVWCVGEGTGDMQRILSAHAADLGLKDLIQWLGTRQDLPSVYNALDVLVSPSLSEGFPNVVAESAACGTPCVVTDVGDSGVIVDDSRYVVPPSSPALLADAIAIALLHESRQSGKWRAKVTERFDRETFVRTTEQALRTAIRSDARVGGPSESA